MRQRFGTTMVGTLLYLFLSLHPATTSATDSAVDVSQPSLQLGSWSRVIRDADASLSADKIFANPQRYPGEKGNAITSFFFTDDAYWFVVPLHNPQHSPLTRILVFEPIWLDDIQVTLLNRNGLREQFYGGDFLPFSQRSLQHRKINFSLQLPPGHSQLFVRVKTVDPFVVNMSLWEPSLFYESDSLETAYLGLVYGVLGAMLLYNLMLFVAIREPVYAAYVAYVACFMTWHIINNGITFEHLWPDSPDIANWSQSISLYLIMMSGLYFAIKFLQLPQRMPRSYHWATALFGAFILSFLLTPLGGYQLHVTSGVLWVIAYTPVLIIFGILALMAGNRAARYFVPATTAGFLGSGITALAVSGFIPFNTYSYRAVDIGMLIDAILLSIALADRLKLARQDVEEARSALFDAAQQYAEDLEMEVAQRTQELREANIAKDKFFSIIAHDLRGPLSSMALFYNDIIKTSHDFTDEILKLTRDSTNQTRDLLEQLLTWARSQRGEINFSPEPLSLSHELQKIFELFSAQAVAKQITLLIDEGGTHWVSADRAMLQTILRNLISNALKYTQPGGVVRVNSREEDGMVQLCIRDNGIGMDVEQQQSLFRLDAKPKSQPGTANESGSGLGLLLCSEFVHRHRGAITVESRPDNGTTFCITLPAAVAQEAKGLQPFSQSLSVLLVDDQQLSRETAAQILKEMGHQVTQAEDGIEALEHCRKQQFELILMDIEMLPVSGIETTRRLRTARINYPVVAYSSYQRSEIEKMDENIRFDGYLDKPLSPDALTLQLHQLFDTGR